MAKRTNQEIEKDVIKIKNASKSATSLKELAELTNLTMQKVRTTLKRHPIIYKRVTSALEDNKKESCKAEEPIRSKVKTIPVNTPSLPKEDVKGKWVVICDAPALVYGLQACTSTSVVIPQFVINTLEGLSQSTDYLGHPLPESLKAAKALSIIQANNWATIAPRLKEETLLVDSKEEYSWRAKALVALACHYWIEGYTVTIKTRTSEIKNLANLQGCITVDFVSADDEVKLVKVS